MNTNKILNATVIVTGLGYFVDMYDLFLFNVTRVPSLTDLGLTGDAITDTGVFILNMQLLGLLIGSFFWGFISDRFGRKSCLLGSILLYSLSTLACGFVQTPDQYAVLRFISGFGLAGEVGIGITLIAEHMSPQSRGKGIALFSALGFLGIIAASVISTVLDWRLAYIIGGASGLVLLAARSYLMESGMFQSIQNKSHTLGDLRILFSTPRLIMRYLCTILVALPLAYCILLYTFSPEIAVGMGIKEPVKVMITVVLFQVFLIIGDFTGALLSDRIQSRKKVIASMKFLAALVMAAFIFWPKTTALDYYIFIALFGFTMGYWVLLTTLGAEQFGTNIRATAATTIPNLVRAMVIPLTLTFKEFKDIDMVLTIGIMGFVVLVVSSIALKGLQETYGKDLDYQDA